MESYIPLSAFDFIRSMQWCLMNFDFLPYKESFPGRTIVSDFVIKQENKYLFLIGVRSSTCVINLYTVGTVLLLVPIAHILVALLHLCMRCLKNNNDCSCFLTRWAAKLFSCLTFGVYILVFMMVYLLLNITVLSDLNEFKNRDPHRQISVGVGGAILGLSAAFTLLGLYKLFTLSKHNNLAKLKYLSGFFDGFKNNWMARLFTTLFIVRRTVLSAIAIFISDGNDILMEALFFAFVQYLYLAYTLVVRPFKFPEDNI